MMDLEQRDQILAAFGVPPCILGPDDPWNEPHSFFSCPTRMGMNGGWCDQHYPPGPPAYTIYAGFSLWDRFCNWLAELVY